MSAERDKRETGSQPSANAYGIGETTSYEGRSVASREKRSAWSVGKGGSFELGAGFYRFRGGGYEVVRTDGRKGSRATCPREYKWDLLTTGRKSGYNGG